MKQHIKKSLSLIKQSLLDPDSYSKKQDALNFIQQGGKFSNALPPWTNYLADRKKLTQNVLQNHFESDDHKIIWKWLHYFDIYHYYLFKFKNRNPTLLEIGVYGGGSLEMWQSYFDYDANLIGIDINEDCKQYEADNISIYIGDQANREFWSKVNADVSKIDIVIDDGGHRPSQQIITLEECLRYINPGGVYICEDVHGFDNVFLDYIHGLSKSLNSYDLTADYHVKANSFQQRINSIHIHPYMVIIKMNSNLVSTFSAKKTGSATGNIKC